MYRYTAVALVLMTTPASSDPIVVCDLSFVGEYQTKNVGMVGHCIVDRIPYQTGQTMGSSTDAEFYLARVKPVFVPSPEAQPFLALWVHRSALPLERPMSCRLENAAIWCGHRPHQ